MSVPPNVVGNNGKQTESHAARRGRRASAALFWVLRVGWGGKGATAASADAAAEWRGRRVRFHGRRREREE